MATEARAILELPDGTRYDVEDRAALIAMAVVLHQQEINRPAIGHLEVAFQGARVHPLRVTSTLHTVDLPSVLQ